MNRQAACLLLASVLAGCGGDGSSYVNVKLTSGTTLTLGSLDVTLVNAGMTGHVTYTKGSSFTVPGDDAFIAKLDSSRRGDVTVTVDAKAPGGTRVASATGTATIVPGGTTFLTIPLSPTVGDMTVTPDQTSGDLSTPPDQVTPRDQATPPDQVTPPDMAAPPDQAALPDQVTPPDQVRPPDQVTPPDMAAAPDASSPPDASTPDAAVPPDPTWALWHMPDSPTPFCTNASTAITCPTTGAFFGQDGNYLIDVPAFTTTTDTVSDSVTKLMWQRNVAGTYTWANAKSYCDGLTLATFSDWRLPTQIELVSIVDFGRVIPPLDPTVFPSTPISFHWASTPAAGDASKAWGVVFHSGNANIVDITTALAARCVRATTTSPGGSRYTVTTDTVLDKSTNLTWQRVISGTSYNWSTALATCDALTLASQSDWRLPSIKELQTLVDYRATTGPVIDLTAFPGTPATQFWSSSPYRNNYSWVWYVDFVDGQTTNDTTGGTTPMRVRCVR